MAKEQDSVGAETTPQRKTINLLAPLESDKTGQFRIVAYVTKQKRFVLFDRLSHGPCPSVQDNAHIGSCQAPCGTNLKALILGKQEHCTYQAVVCSIFSFGVEGTQAEVQDGFKNTLVVQGSQQSGCQAVDGAQTFILHTQFFLLNFLLGLAIMTDGFYKLNTDIPKNSGYDKSKQG